MGEGEFQQLFARLKSMLAPYADRMYVSADSPQWFGVDMAPEAERDPSTWFGAARVGKRYVSYYPDAGLRAADAARRPWHHFARPARRSVAVAPDRLYWLRVCAVDADHPAETDQVPDRARRPWHRGRIPRRRVEHPAANVARSCHQRDQDREREQHRKDDHGPRHGFAPRPIPSPRRAISLHDTHVERWFSIPPSGGDVVWWKDPAHGDHHSHQAHDRSREWDQGHEHVEVRPEKLKECVDETSAHDRRIGCLVNRIPTSRPRSGR